MRVKNINVFYIVLLLVLTLGAGYYFGLRESIDDQKNAAKVLSNSMHTFAVHKFSCPDDVGKKRIYCSTKPMASALDIGGRALIMRESSKSGQKEILLTIQDRGGYRDKYGFEERLFAEFPAGGFERERHDYGEPEKLFEIREGIIYKSLKDGMAIDHTLAHDKALEIYNQNAIKESDGANVDYSLRQAAMREAYEETGLSALLMPEKSLLDNNITMSKKLISIDDSNTHQHHTYLINFVCDNCNDFDFMEPRISNDNLEVDMVEWVNVGSIKEDEKGILKAKFSNGKEYPIRYWG